jgi:hypothetical protein
MSGLPTNVLDQEEWPGLTFWGKLWPRLEARPGREIWMFIFSKRLFLSAFRFPLFEWQDKSLDNFVKIS